jgi:excisionase family DNA binding protein
MILPDSFGSLVQQDAQMAKCDTKLTFDPISYTPEQAALVTGRSRSRIFKAIKDKELTARKDGRATLIESAELRRWLGSLPTIGRQPVAPYAQGTER